MSKNFNLDKNQQKLADDWIKTQLTQKPKYSGAIGGRFTFSFTPTNLGTIIKIEDNQSKETLDITDYSTW